MAPVILALRQAPWAQVRILATAQHRDMLDQVLTLFGIVPDIDLDIMRPNQDLTTLTARLLTGRTRCSQRQPAVVLAQGDTTTVMTVALASYRRIAFGHVEAGLRTGDLHNPFPEEANRVIAGHLARWHFCAHRDLAGQPVARGDRPGGSRSPATR
ncbi:MAG: UDP-N-acetylglucosamine 2-epimerase [Burkholderiaceae bacterium]